MFQIALIFQLFYLKIVCQTKQESESMLTTIVSQIQGGIEGTSKEILVSISFPDDYSNLMNIEKDEGEIEVKLFQCSDQFYNCSQIDQRNIISEYQYPSRKWSFYPINLLAVPYLDGTIRKYGYYYYEFAKFNEIHYYIFEFQVQTIKNTNTFRSLNFKEIKSETVILSRIDFYRHKECTSRITDNSMTYNDSIKFIKFEILNPDYVEYSQEFLRIVIIDTNEQYAFSEIKEEKSNYTILAMPNIKYFTEIRVYFRLKSQNHQLTIQNSRMVNSRMINSRMVDSRLGKEICKKQLQISQTLFGMIQPKLGCVSTIQLYSYEKVYITLQILESGFKDKYYINPFKIIFKGDGLYYPVSISQKQIVTQQIGITIFYFQVTFTYQDVTLLVYSDIRQDLSINSVDKIEQIQTFSNINLESSYYLAYYSCAQMKMNIDFCSDVNCETFFTPKYLHPNITVILKLSLDGQNDIQLNPQFITIKGLNKSLSIVKFLKRQQEFKFTLVKFEMQFVEPAIKIEVISNYNSQGFNSTTDWIESCLNSFGMIKSACISKPEPCYIYALLLRYQLLLILLYFLQ